MKSRATKRDLERELAELRRQVGDLRASAAGAQQDPSMPPLQQTSEMLASVLFDSITDMITVQDTQYNILRFNRAVEKVYGRQALGQKCYKAYQDRDEVCPDCPMAKALATGEAAFSPYQAPPGKRAVEIWSFPVKDDHGSIVAVLEHGRDITDQRQAEIALMQAEERYRTVFDSAGDAVLVHDLQGRLLDVNQVACERLGYSRDEMLKMRSQDIDTPEFAALVPRRIGEIQENGYAIFQTAHRRRDGTVIPIEASSRPIAYNGRPAIITVARDISERKRIEEELFRLRKAVETSGEAIFMTDRDGTITFVNPEFTRLYGWSASEVQGKATPRVLKSGILPPEAYAQFWKILLDRQVMKGELVNKTRDGRLVDIEGSSNPILDDRGDIVGFLAIQRDITARKKAERELLASKSRLERIHGLSQVLSRSLELDKVLRLALVEVANTFNRTRTTAGIALTDDWGQQLRVVAAKGEDEDTAVGATFPVSAFQPATIARLFKERKPWVFHEIHEAPEVLKARPGFMEQRNLVLIPLFVGDLSMGYLFLGSSDPKPYEPPDISLLETYASEIAMAIQNARLFTRTEEALRQRVSQFEALTNVLIAATKSLGLKPLLKDVLKLAADVFAVQAAGLSLSEEDGARLSVQMHYDRRDGSFKDAAIDYVASNLPLWHGMFNVNEPIMIPDTETLPGYSLDAAAGQWQTRSALVVPMVHSGKTIGTLQFTDSTRRTFAANEVSLAQAIASYVASLIQNARLHERTEKERGTLESILASMGEGLIVVDKSRNVVYFNPAAETLTSIRAREVLGKPVDVFQDMLSRRVVDKETVSSWLSEVLSQTEQTPRMYYDMSSYPARLTVEATPFPVGGAASRLGTGMLLRDVTKEREVDRMKTEFVSIVSHELRTPMTAVYGFAELLLTRAAGLPPEQMAWVQAIYREGGRLSNIVEDLLDVSRIEAGRLSLNMGLVKVGSVAGRVAEQLQTGHPLHSLATDIPEDVPEVLADKDKLQQVLYNLVDNAVKYSPKGGPVVISARLDPGSKQVIVTVSDMGMGIPEEEMPRLFTRFHRVHRPETAGMRGTGLGLHIARSLTEMMGGRIWADSTVNEGSKFHISLTLADHA